MRPRKIISYCKDPYQLGWWNFWNLNLFLPDDSALKSRLSGRTTILKISVSPFCPKNHKQKNSRTGTLNHIQNCFT